VRDIAELKSPGQYSRKTGSGDVFNTFTTISSDARFKSATGINDTDIKSTVKS
jgi:hypothetical protein